MKPLRIAMVTGLFPAVSETFIVNQVLALKEIGHKVDVFCFKKNDSAIHDNSQNVINVKELAWRQFMPQSYGKKLLKIAEILFKSLSKGLFFVFFQALFSNGKIHPHAFFKTYYHHLFKLEGYDVVHVHFGTNAIRLLPLLKHFDKKIIVTFHGFDAHNFDNDFYAELLSLNHIIYTVNTEFTKHKLIKLGFSETSINILPVGLDTNFFKPNKKAHSTFNILFVGRLIELKAPLLAIQIVEKLTHQGLANVRLTIIGEGDEFKQCNDYINANELSDYISLVGNKSQSEIVDYMNNSNAFLFPGIIDKNGRCEAQGLVIQEAQSMELPVIVSNVGGIPDGLVHEQTGYVVQANDIDAFSNCLLMLITDAQKQKAIGQAGREFVIKHYDNQVLVTKLLTIYQS